MQIAITGRVGCGERNFRLGVVERDSVQGAGPQEV